MQDRWDGYGLVEKRLEVDDRLAEFSGQEYLSVESYRRNGRAVPTPVWFAQDGPRVYVRTMRESGKVKRIRNNPCVRIVPCDVRGASHGHWVNAKARIVEAVEAEHANSLLKAKYGLAKRAFDTAGMFRHAEWAVIAIEEERGEACGGKE